MKKEKTLVIIRGLPGSGKTTLANLVSRKNIFSADDYFYDIDGTYNFNPEKLYEAHKSCKERLVNSIEFTDDKFFIVNNTFTTEKEIKPYKNIADRFNMNFISIITENRHGNKSVHEVPEETLSKMQKRFSIKL